MGQIADAIYVQFINQERREEWLAPDPNGIRTLPPNLPTKWALLQVLSKNCWISTAALKVLLTGMSYTRSISAYRRALQRCLKFGLVVRETFYNETDVLKGKKRRKHAKWKMTERGRQLANANPSQVLKGRSKKTYVSPQQTQPGKGSDRARQDRVLAQPGKVLGP